MRVLAVVILTVCQFTAFPFIAIVAANTARHSEEARMMSAGAKPNVTVVYKTQASPTIEM